MTMSKSYYRIMLGESRESARESYNGKWVGGGWGFTQDLRNELSVKWREFNRKFIPVYLKANPTKAKIAAGLACGMLYTICKGIKVGDVVLCPDREGSYWVGEIVGEYYNEPSHEHAHRREVEWQLNKIARSDMSETLKGSTGSPGTVADISKHATEIEGLIVGSSSAVLRMADEQIESQSAFAFERHLEDYLVKNWEKTELGKSYDIYFEGEQKLGQQFPTDTGPIDILAISKDQSELLVVELKRGRASDVVVGQIQRYIGFVMDELAGKKQSVRGCIIAHESDIRLQHALRATPNVDFFRYTIDFKLNRE